MSIDKDIWADLDLDEDDGPDPLDPDYIPSTEDQPHALDTEGNYAADKYVLDKDGNLPSKTLGPEALDPKHAIIIYEGLSARFQDGVTLDKKLASVAGLTMFVKAGPLLLGDLFNDLYDQHKLSDEEIGQHFDLADGTVKNMRMWARKIPGENRRPGIETTLAQEASSIKDHEEQAAFIKRALEEGLSKAEMRAVKQGKEPEDHDESGEEVDMVKCPTCGTHVRAELIG